MNGYKILMLAGMAMFMLIIFGMNTRQETNLPEDMHAGDLFVEPCKIKLQGHRYEAECGYLTVSENRNDPHARLIKLTVTKIKATGEASGAAIFYLEGGPGMSNMHAKPSLLLLENHDLVMIGYRGVDGDVKLDCSEVGDALKGVGSDLLSDESLLGVSTAMQNCSERLEQEGIDLSGYSVHEVVLDIEAGRQAFGYEQINLFSFSYGTRIAQLYAHLYPDNVLRSIMIGVNPPGHFVWEPSTLDSQIEYFSELYAGSDNPKTGNLAETMRNVAANMPARWMGIKIDPGKVKSVTFALLFVNRSTPPMVFDAYISAENGDASGLALMSLAYDFVIPSMSVWGEFFSKGISADLDSGRDYVHEMDPDDSIIGSPLSKLIWGAVTIEGKSSWPTGLISEELRRVNETDVETLLISGSIDVSTPAENATNELLPSLKNGHQVILSDVGHVSDVMTFQSEAIEHLISTYYATGKVDDSKIEYAPMNFDVGLGLPEIAKITLVVTGILSLVIGILLWFGIRWLKHRQ